MSEDITKYTGGDIEVLPAEESGETVEVTEAVYLRRVRVVAGRYNVNKLLSANQAEESDSGMSDGAMAACCRIIGCEKKVPKTYTSIPPEDPFKDLGNNIDTEI